MIQATYNKYHSSLSTYYKRLSSLAIAHYLLLVLLLAVSCLLFAGQAAAQVAGKITAIEGRVDILRAGTAAATPVKTGDAVNVGDILRTKSDGKAEITFIDRSIMTVGPKSRLGIDEYLFKPEEQKRTASLNLYRGRSGFQIPKPVYAAEGSKFEMKTKTAVAGVRGTEGLLYTDGIERVYVKDGVIEFKNPLGSVTVSKGEVGEIFHGKAPVERPYNEKEYKKQEEGTKPKPPTSVKDEKAPPPEAGDFALLPPKAPPTEVAVLPPPSPPPVVPITDSALNKVFKASASILDGEINWFGTSGSNYEGTAAVIQSGSISGSFNQTIIEGGYYKLDMSGSYAWDTSRSQVPPINVTDDWSHFFYSGSTSEGKPFYGVSVAEIAVSNKSWSGGNIGWIEDGSKKYWYLGELDGSYSTIFYNNNSGSRSGQSGTFSTTANGLFWDGSRPFWEVFSKIIPTLPGANPDVFVPITETALRIFDINFNTGQSLTLKDASSTSIGSVSVTSGPAGKGIELTPGSGLFDVNVNGNWSVSSGNITNVREINGTINGSTSINTSFAMSVDGGVKSINSNTAIVGAFVGKSTGTEETGVMIGKMTGSTSGTLDAKAIGEMKPGFILP